MRDPMLGLGMLTHWRWITATLGLLPLLPSLASGQICWRAHPRPVCRLIWITESGPRFGGNEAFGDGHVGSATAVGLMTARNTFAFGAALELTTGGESGTYRLTVMPRYRRWLSSAVTLDLGAGVAILGEGERAGGFKGLSALAGIGITDFVGVVAEVESRRGTSLGTQTAASVGVRFGSYLGPLVAVASLVVGIVAASGAD